MRIVYSASLLFLVAALASLSGGVVLASIQFSPSIHLAMASLTLGAFAFPVVVLGLAFVGIPLGRLYERLGVTSRASVLGTAPVAGAALGAGVAALLYAMMGAGPPHLHEPLLLGGLFGFMSGLWGAVLAVRAKAAT